MIAVPPDGQRAMNTFLGASRELGPDDIHEDDIAASEILYIEGYLWDSQVSKEASRKAIANALLFAAAALRKGILPAVVAELELAGVTLAETQG